MLVFIFLWIFVLGKRSNDEAQPGKEIVVRKDDWIEKTHLRKLAAENAKELAFDLFDIYKKAHGMPSYTGI